MRRLALFVAVAVWGCDEGNEAMQEEPEPEELAVEICEAAQTEDECGDAEPPEEFVCIYAQGWEVAAGSCEPEVRSRCIAYRQGGNPGCHGPIKGCEHNEGTDWPTIPIWRATEGSHFVLPWCGSTPQGGWSKCASGLETASPAACACVCELRPD